jgi:hypothetical protein
MGITCVEWYVGVSLDAVHTGADRVDVAADVRAVRMVWSHRDDHE